MATQPAEKTSKTTMPDIQPTETDQEHGQTQKVDLSMSEEEAESVLALQRYVPGTAEEKRLVRKIDFMLIPCLWWMYILAYLDRGNIANANAAGLSTDLGLSDSQYSLFISTFFVGYFICNIPSNLLLTRVRPSIYLPSLMLIWGAIVAAMSTSKQSTGFLVGRFFLGCIEAGFFPGVLYFLTCWYKKEEVGKRFALFYTAGCVSPALGGIMAGAIISGLEGARGIAGWRWLLLIEGVITVGFSFIFYLVLLDYPLNTKRLSPEERQLAYVRILYDRKSNVASDKMGLTPWQAIWAAICDVRTWVFTIIYTLDSSSTTISYFIPTILKNMGYTSVTAQWMTVPIWMVGAVFMVIFSFTSDKTRDRRWHNTGLLALPFVCCMISIGVTGAKVQYVMICFMIAGLYTAVALILNWTTETIALPHQKRAVASAIVNAIGNLSIIYGSYLWPSADKPRYTKGFASVGAFTGAGALLAALAPLIFKLLPERPATKAERDLLERQNALPTVQETSEGRE